LKEVLKIWHDIKTKLTNKDFFFFILSPD